jgi:hypothetical protein
VLDNLQTLCFVCNGGKNNKDETNFREASKTALMIRGLVLSRNFCIAFRTFVKIYTTWLDDSCATLSKSWRLRS